METESFVEMSDAGFYPVGNGRFTFQHRGVRLSVTLLDSDTWYCLSGLADKAIKIHASVSALDMADQLRKFIVATTPPEFLCGENYNDLDWIGSSVRAARRAEGIPFNGELNPDDADDSIPAQYGL